MEKWQHHLKGPKLGVTFSLIALLVCMSVNEIVIMERDVLLAALLVYMIDSLKFMLIKELKDYTKGTVMCL